MMNRHPLLGISMFSNFDPHAIQDSVQTFFVERLSTGNTVLNAILAGLVCLLLLQLTDEKSHIMSLVSSLYARMVNWVFKTENKGEIEFLIEVMDLGSNCFTPTYRAIMHKLGTLQDDQVWRFKEKRLEWYDNSESKNVTESLYQVLQTEPILVENDVWAKCEENTEDRPNAEGTRVINIITYTLRIYSKVHTVHSLKKTVDRWLQEYKNYKKEQLVGKQLIFMVRFPESNNNSEPQDDASEKIKYSTFKTFRSFENLFFEEKENVLNDINFFLEEKEWHKKRGLPDSLGILCYGVPGCGKTSFIKALLRKTNRHGVIFSVNKCTRIESIEKLMRSETLCDFPIPQSQRIYILEDIDAMGDLVTRRKEGGKDVQEEEKPKITQEEEEKEEFQRHLFKYMKFGLSKSSDHHLGFFLNLLDGLIETPGRIIVMTTNHVDKLDPALIRPGRIDIKIEFKKCTRNIIKHIMSHFYAKDVNDWALDERIVNGEITGAEMTQICRANKFDFDGAIKDLIVWMEKKKRQTENVGSPPNKNYAETKNMNGRTKSIPISVPSVTHMTTSIQRELPQLLDETVKKNGILKSERSDKSIDSDISTTRPPTIDTPQLRIVTEEEHILVPTENASLIPALRDNVHNNLQKEETQTPTQQHQMKEFGLTQLKENLVSSGSLIAHFSEEMSPTTNSSLAVEFIEDDSPVKPASLSEI